MAYINPFIKVNAGGIPRLEARNTPTVDASNNLTYDFYEHRFLNYPYAGIIIFKLPAVTTPAAGNVYFTTGGSNSAQVFNKAGAILASNNTDLVAEGVEPSDILTSPIIRLSTSCSNLVSFSATPPILTKLLLPAVGSLSTPCQSAIILLQAVAISLYCTYLLPEIELSLLEINLHIIT